MTPEQRERAHRGMKRWRHMDPEQREQARALFHKMRGMSKEDRSELRKQWHAMTPEQRRQWVEQNARSEEHTSELQSLMRISYAVFCLKKKTRQRETSWWKTIM